MNDRILWMHDLSERADGAAGAIRTLARWVDGEVRLVHATGAAMEDHDRGEDPTLAARRDAALARLEPMVAWLQTEGVAADLVVAAGQPLALAEDLVRGERGALVVVAGTGTRGIDRVLLGSTSGRLVRHLPCSVLVVHGNLSRVSRMLCAVDPEAPSEAAVLQATALAHRSGAALDYVSVVAPILDLAETEPAEERVRQAVAQITGEPLPARWSVRSVVAETPVQGILHIASSYELLVVGTHGRTGLKRLLLGSVAEAVVAGSPVCVLVAR